MELTPEQVEELDEGRRRALFYRTAGIEEIRDTVRDIVDRVRADGDAALRDFSRDFDDVELDAIDVTDRVDGARNRIDPDVLEAIETASENVRSFHERQLRSDWREESGGRSVGRRFRPLDRVGVYAPGGTAAYPSSVLMGVIPATVAGVDEVAVATPPAEELNPVTLAAIDVADADEVYSLGGAQAVAALAYGTETVDPVQKVVGPGNRWVTAAKAAVQGTVAIDFLAGPSEILVVADETADPSFVAADLLAQAEHDPNSSVVAVTDDSETAEAICTAVESAIAERERSSVIEESLSQDASGVFVAHSMAEATSFAESYASEHLSIQTADDEAVLDRIDSAGSVFLGPYTPVAAGDYATGTNHVLPTSAKAKVVGGLSVDTFTRASTVQRLSEEGLSDLEATITTLARAEGLEAHAASVEERLRGEPSR
ncbi:MAG: histidinol dehydrogenase [Halodesulfurarchaeum sp.]